jgi:transcriptional regulator with XRE-family HTH domain
LLVRHVIVMYEYCMLSPPQFRFPTPRDIERLAFEAGVSIGALCERAGVSSQAFRNWKFGRVSPTLNTVQKLAEAGIALLAEADGAGAAPATSRRKPAGKPVAAKPAALRGAKLAARAKAAAAKRPARRQM